MCWDSDKFIGVEGFKKTIPKHRCTTLGKYLYLADLTTENWNNLLSKVHPLVTHLEQKFAEAYTPGKTSQLMKVLSNLMGGFPLSSTCQWSLINLASKFGFLPTLTHTMFHASKCTWARIEEQWTISRKSSWLLSCYLDSWRALLE